MEDSSSDDNTAPGDEKRSEVSGEKGGNAKKRRERGAGNH